MYIRIHAGHHITTPDGVSKEGRAYDPYVQFYLSGRVPLRVYGSEPSKRGSLEALLKNISGHLASGVTHLTVVAGPEATRNGLEFKAWTSTLVLRPATEQEIQLSNELDARVFEAEFRAVLERRMTSGAAEKPRATEVKEEVSTPTVPSRPKASSAFPE